MPADGTIVGRIFKAEPAAGFVPSQLGHLPEVGESFDSQGWRFEVVDLDGRRINKILVSRIASRATAGSDVAKLEMLGCGNSEAIGLKPTPAKLRNVTRGF